MAVINPIVAQRSIDVGGIPSTQIDDGVGRGLQQVGGEVSQHANRLLEMKRQDQAFAGQQSFNRWQDDNALEFAKLQERMSVSGEGFADQTSSAFTKRAEEFLQNAPPELQGRMQELVGTARNQWVNRGIATQVDQRNSWFRTTLTQRAQTLENQAFENPSAFQDVQSAMDREITASGLTDTEKAEWRQKTSNLFSMAALKREVVQNPGGAMQSIGIARTQEGDGRKVGYLDVAKSFMGATEANDSQAIAEFIKRACGISIDPKQTAWCAAFVNGILGSQNLGGTGSLAARSFLNYGAETKEPQVGDVVVLTRGNPNSQYGHVGFYAGKTADGKIKILGGNQSNGVNVSSYDASRVLSYRRPPEAKDGQQAQANLNNLPGGAPDGGLTVTSMDPRFANLSLQQRLSMFDQANAELTRRRSAVEAQNKAAVSQRYDDLTLGATLGSVSEADVLSDGLIDNGQKATLVQRVRSAQNGALQTQEALAAFASGNLTVDPYSTDGRKTVDAVGEQIGKSVPAEQQQPAYEELVRQSGTLPQSVLNNIRAGADSQVAAEVQAAMQAASRFAQINPAALGRREGGDAIQRKVDDFDYYVNTLNLDPSDASRRIAEQNDPNKVRDRKALEPAAKEFRKQLEGADIGAMFDDSFMGWRSNPNVGFTEGQAAGIAADYLAIAEEQFYLTSGNTDLAKSRAEQEMKRLYGTSEIGGSKTIMKYPPEKYWPGMPGESDPYAYAKDQLINDLAEAFPDDPLLNPKKSGTGFVGTVDGRTVDIRDESGLPEYRNMVRDTALSRIVLVATPETGAEAKSNQLPGYTVLYKDENGNLQTLYGKQWRPDPQAVVSGSRRQQQDRMGRAEIYQQTGQGVADYLAGGEIPMGAGTAWDNPEVQQTAPAPAPSAPVPTTVSPTIQSGLQDQRSQLFQNAQQSGILTPGGM